VGGEPAIYLIVSILLDYILKNHFFILWCRICFHST
jgi:hypothetical protein